MDNPLKALLPEPGQEKIEHVEAPAADTPPEPQAAPEGPARDADGKFAAKEPAPPEASQASQASPTPAPQAPDPGPSPGGHVPISALLDERDQRQKAQQKAKALEDRIAAQQKAAAEPLPPEERYEAALYAQNLRVSRRFAERQYGPELTSTVHDWAVARCDADPIFNAQMRTSDDPYEAAMQAYNREQILAAVGPGDLEAFNAWKAAQAELQTQAPVPQPAAPAPVPRSLATAPGNGAAGQAHIVVAEGEAFRAAIR
ncbi:MAG: hypothetical protein ACREEB_04205 [Caulobacteraceae bacterium]